MKEKNTLEESPREKVKSAYLEIVRAQEKCLSEGELSHLWKEFYGICDNLVNSTKKPSRERK